MVEKKSLPISKGFYILPAKKRSNRCEKCRKLSAFAQHNKKANNSSSANHFSFSVETVSKIKNLLVSQSAAKNVFENITQAIGNTPLVKLNNLSKGLKAAIYLKLEFMNPGGSVKDRIGVKMIEDAEKRGLLRPGGIIVEPTSGNTGVGLAMSAALKGYKIIFTMPDKMSKEKELLLRAYGAEIIRTPTNVAPDDPKSYIQVAKNIVMKLPNAWMPNQYFNPNNPLAHYETTGPEIWKQTGGKVTHVVAGMGTGGTITGIAYFLKEKNPEVKIIGVDPEGSMYHHEFYGTKGDVHSYKVEGIGEDFMPATIDLSIVDEIVTVTDETAFEVAKELARKEGILAGGSSGAAVFAALKLAKEKDLDENAVVVVILPDRGDRYLSKFYSDEWLKENGFTSS